MASGYDIAGLALGVLGFTASLGRDGRGSRERHTSGRMLQRIGIIRRSWQWGGPTKDYHLRFSLQCEGGDAFMIHVVRRDSESIGDDDVVTHARPRRRRSYFGLFKSKEDVGVDEDLPGMPVLLLDPSVAKELKCVSDITILQREHELRGRG